MEPNKSPFRHSYPDPEDVRRSDPEKLLSLLREKERQDLLTTALRDQVLSLQDLEEECQRLDIRFRGQRFWALQVRLVAWEETFYSGAETVPERVCRFIRFVLRNVTEELLGEENLTFSLTVRGNYCCLLDTSAAEETYLRRLREAVPVMEQTLLENCGVSIQIDATGLVSGLAQLPTLYRQLEDLGSYRVLLQDDRTLLTWVDISQETSFVDHFKNADRLIHQVSRGEYDAAAEGFLALSRQMFSPAPDYHTANYLFVRLCGLARELLSAAARRLASLPGWKELDVARLVSDLSAVQALEDAVQSVLARAADAEAEHSDVPRWFGQLVQTLQQEYTDPNLNVNTLADRFGITASYLSRTFRKLMGTGLPDHIHALRVAEAKKHLQAGKSVKETAALVGYSSQLTMSRAFIRLEGKNPADLLR